MGKNNLIKTWENNEHVSPNQKLDKKMITKYRKEIDRYMKIHQIGFYAKKVSDVKSKSL